MILELRKELFWECVNGFEPTADLRFMKLKHARIMILFPQPLLYSDRRSRIRMVLYLSMLNVTRVDGQPVAAYKSLVMPGDKYWRIVFFREQVMTILTPFSSDQMIRNFKHENW